MTRQETREPSAEVQRRLYELMALMKAADDRLTKGIADGRVPLRVLAVAVDRRRSPLRSVSASATTTSS